MTEQLQPRTRWVAVIDGKMDLKCTFHSERDADDGEGNRTAEIAVVPATDLRRLVEAFETARDEAITYNPHSYSMSGPCMDADTQKEADAALAPFVSWAKEQE